MRSWLTGAILVASAVAGALTEIILFRMVQSPDDESAVLGAAWVAMPYLAAAGLAFLFRRHAPALLVLLVMLLIVAAVGVYLFDASATQLEIARQQAATAVLPGEDPDRGAAAMRKTGAEAGVAVGGVFSILLAVVLPPVQLAGVVIPAGIGYGVSVWLLHRAESRRVWELEHTDTRGPAG